MSDLVAFLNARLDEDEIVAEGLQTHVLRFGPERMLREVEAKRRIIDSESSLYVKGHVPPTVTLKALAAVYSDHPDYDPAWLH